MHATTDTPLAPLASTDTPRASAGSQLASTDTPRAPRVSIIIPAYNSGRVIGTSCACALAQTERDLEVIVIDDGSSDDTAARVEEIAAHDARVRLVRHPENRGRLEARRTGIQHAAGTFTLFLDSDDEIAPDLAEHLLTLQDDRFDIVQCSFEMRYLAYITPDERQFNDDFNRAPDLEAEGDDVTHVVFRDRLTTWSLCGKLMRTDLLKRAIAEVPPSSLTQAEDACIYFIVSCLAESYKGVGDYRGYVYNIDLGGSDARWKQMDLDQFAFSCRYVDSMDLIGAYIERNGLWERLVDDYQTVRYEHVRAVADKLVTFVERPLRADAYDKLVTSWDVEEAVAALSEVAWDAPADCLQNVAKADALHCPPRPVRTVAAYLYNMHIGGAERVAADLVNLWHDQGLRVVFFADAPQSECAYELPEDVVWVQLPEAVSMERGGYLPRAQAIARALRRYQVDAYVSHQWWSPLLAWDLMLVKTLGVPFCLISHNLFMAQFYEPNPHEFDHSRIIRHTDALVVLSEADKRFWDKFNPRVRCTVNPMTTWPDEARRSKLTGKNVVWVGRLSSFDKQPQEALRIMARVMAHDPDCTLTLVGPAPSDGDLQHLKMLARSLGIEDRVEFAGPHDDPSPFYERAAVHLLTSRVDGWCLVLAESKAHGLPCVMYEMPYLTLTQGERGIIAVPQGDREGAARAVSALLDDESQRRALGQEAFEHIKEIAAVDRGAFWRDLFEELGHGSPERAGFEDADAEWDQLISGFKTSIDKALDLPVSSYVKRKGLKVAKAAWHRLHGRF